MGSIELIDSRFILSEGDRKRVLLDLRALYENHSGRKMSDYSDSNGGAEFLYTFETEVLEKLWLKFASMHTPIPMQIVLLDWLRMLFKRSRPFSLLRIGGEALFPETWPELFHSFHRDGHCYWLQQSGRPAKMGIISWEMPLCEMLLPHSWFDGVYLDDAKEELSVTVIDKALLSLRRRGMLYLFTRRAELQKYLSDLCPGLEMFSLPSGGALMLGAVQQEEKQAVWQGSLLGRQELLEKMISEKLAELSSNMQMIEENLLPGLIEKTMVLEQLILEAYQWQPVDDSKYLVNELKSSLIDCRLGLGSTGTVKDKFCALQEAMVEL